ncbi:MAG: tetratricopeptide repeat protein, partial [Myxococcales bacterium]|nr:tetratricopeptide repeat protein [Myxococcales bacterium]
MQRLDYELPLVRADAEACAGMEAQLAGVWDPTRRADVKRALLATRAAYAEDTWRLVEGRLDRYAHAWVATREGMCAATRAGEQSAALLDLRMACLDGQLHFVRATIDELHRADPEIVAAGARMVAALPDPASCSREAVLSTQQRTPRDPAVADAVAALDEALATARAKESAGRYDEALTLADEVVGAAERLGDEPLLARAWLRHGAILDKSGQYEGAAAELERALTAALAQSMRDESADAASQLLYVVGYQQARVEDGRRWVAIARALARASGSPRAAARAAIHAGTLEFTSGHYAQAHDLWEEGLAHLEADPTADELDLLSPLGNLAVVARRQGRYADARRHSARALEIAERELGPLHPDLADILNDMGAVANEEGRLDAAREHWERALAIGSASLGPDHPSLAASLSNLGLVATNTGDLEAARRYLERALAIDEAALGPDH